jgi:hypothetical protein
VDVDAYVVGAPEPALTGVDPDPDPDTLRLGPILVSETALDLDRAGYGIEGGLIGHEKAISLVLHDTAAMRLRSLVDDRVVSFQDRSKGIAQLLEHPRRALDVGEEKADRPYREGA